jgi:hypothetical protein
MENDLESLKYPIGKFSEPEQISDGLIKAWIVEIQALPSKVRNATQNLKPHQLDTPYRLNGWTIRQVVHHLPDSHLNAYIRFKLAITEDQPIIRPYFEERWAETADAKNGNIDVSLDLLDSLHKRWVAFMTSLTAEDLERIFIHPEHGKSFMLKSVIGMYAWHGNHHLAHIRNVKF